VEKDCQACKLNKEDAMDHSRWRKLIKDVWWSGWVWVGECFFWYRPTPKVLDKGLLNSCIYNTCIPLLCALCHVLCSNSVLTFIVSYLLIWICVGVIIKYVWGTRTLIGCYHILWEHRTCCRKWPYVKSRAVTLKHINRRLNSELVLTFWWILYRR